MCRQTTTYSLMSAFSTRTLLAPYRESSCTESANCADFAPQSGMRTGAWVWWRRATRVRLQSGFCLTPGEGRCGHGRSSDMDVRGDTEVASASPRPCQWEDGTVRRFVCGDHVPFCKASWSCRSQEELLAHAVLHARMEHCQEIPEAWIKAILSEGIQLE